MEFGAHLQLMDFGGHPYTIEHLIAYARAADRLGFTALAANDHMVYSLPWLDGPAALAAVMAHSGSMSLITSVALPVVRGPVQLAKSIGAIDRLSGGRAIVAVGPGAQRRDYEAVGLDFEERWARFDESIQMLRALWRGGQQPFNGKFYSSAGIVLRPRPARAAGPSIWVGSWGSVAGMRRTARLGDGWVASAYNTTPAEFADARERLGVLLATSDRTLDTFPNGLSTMWFYLTDDAREAERVYRERLFPHIDRPENVLRDRLPVGPAEDFARRLTAYEEARCRESIHLAARRRSQSTRAILRDGRAVTGRLSGAAPRRHRVSLERGVRAQSRIRPAVRAPRSDGTFLLWRGGS